MAEAYETRGEIDAELGKLGLEVSDTRLERWRGRGILPRVEQVQHAYRGSETRYPAGTAAQIIEIFRLIAVRDDLDFVGWELWWGGFPVEARCWRPRLERVARHGDRLIALTRKGIARSLDREEDDTIYDKAAGSNTKNSFFRKARRRVGIADMPTAIRLLLEVVTGEFESERVSDEDKQIIRKIADILGIDKHAINGLKILFEPLLYEKLDLFSKILQMNSLATVLGYSESEFEGARDTLRPIMPAIQTFYAVMRQKFGPKAFGLRTAARLFDTANPDTNALYIMALAALRRNSNDVLSPENVAEIFKPKASQRPGDC
jgi:hypothetical protein